MDLNELTNDEVQQLISSMKKLKKQLNFDHISSLIGKVDNTETVLGIHDDVEFMSQKVVTDTIRKNNSITS